MKYSKHNIFSLIRGSENYFIVNLLSGNADILNFEEAAIIDKIRKGEEVSADGDFIEDIKEKGYITEAINEEITYRQKYLDFIDTREKDEVQLFFVLNYTCNFGCSYCYQDEYENLIPENRTDIIDSFIRYVGSEFAGRKKYITLFGGEPLLGSPVQKKLIEHLISKATEAHLPLCVVTNGYHLSEYVDILKKGEIREIQVTLDGTAEFHNKRRPLKGGGTTFDRIVEGIDLCLASKMPVNLRMVIDRENIENLPYLARFAKEKGWTSNPLFKTQLGRNYELHHCQGAKEKLFDRVSLYEKIYEIALAEPVVLEFHKPAYSISRYLAENGALPDPLFDSCPACKTEWAFDYTGNIYPCTAYVGKNGESLGTYFPTEALIQERIEEWENRDVTSITVCSSCNLQLACGGGCGAVAKNSSGKILSPDCRPVKELLELGFSAYFSE